MKKLMSALLLIIISLVCSCTTTATESSAVNSGTVLALTGQQVSIDVVKDSLVQAWNDQELLSTGVAAGDGNHVLTVLNWEVTFWGNVDVVKLYGERRQASVQAVNPRTGVTCLF